MHELHQRALEAIERATTGMSAAEMEFHTEGKWSAALILEHLALAFAGTAKMLERCLAEGRPLGDVPKLDARAKKFLVVTLGYFPPGRKAPKHVEPTGALAGSEAVRKIRSDLERMDALHAECYRKIGTKGWIANHPVLGPMTIDEWPRFHWVHTRHHMKQIERLRRVQAASTQKASA